MFSAEYPQISYFNLEVILEHIYLTYYEEGYADKNLNDLSATKDYFQKRYNEPKWEGFLEDLFDYIENILEYKTDQQVFDMPKESIEKLYRFIRG